MKSMMKIYALGFTLVFTIMAQAAETREKPLTPSQHNDLQHQYQNAQRQLEQKTQVSSTATAGLRIKKMQNGKTMSVTSSSSLGVINLPGATDNDTQLQNAMNNARTNMSAMKGLRKSPAEYAQYQQQASLALDAAVSSYLHSRAASKINLDSTEVDDPFLQEMASLKMDVLKNKLTSAKLTGMLDRLESARTMLVELSDTGANQ